MNAEFFALAFSAALNPKLLALDLPLIENRRPRAMFLCVLLGGMTVALTIGLVDVLTRPRRCDQLPGGKASAGVDPVGLDYWIWPGRTSRLGSSLSDHFGCLPARVPSARLHDGASPG
jgi:hypothetical protein